MGTLWQDIKYGARVLTRKPGTTVVVILTLALGLGANLAIFSLVNAFLFRPLPLPEPDRLVSINSKTLGSPAPFNLSYPDFLDVREQAEDFADITGYALSLAGISADDQAEMVIINYVPGNYFRTLGVQSALGHLRLTEGEALESDAPLAVLGHSYWSRRFAGDPSVLGRQVYLNGRSFTVIGVTEKGFKGAYPLTETAVYVTVNHAEALSSSVSIDQRNSRDLRTLGRLLPSVTIEQAQASLSVISARLAQDYPETNEDLAFLVFPETSVRPEPEAALFMPILATVFMALVGLVLLLTCVNVATVLLVRATAREREFGIRAALGAGRWRLMQQFFTESVLLAFAGGLAGLAAGYWASRSLSAVRLPGDMPFVFDFSFDWRIFTYGAALALGAGLVIGLLPAVRGSRPDVNDALREGGRTGTAGRSRHLVRNALVVAQISVSLVLLIAAGLFVRSLQEARKMELGFRAQGVLNVSFNPKMLGYGEDRARELFRDIEQEVRALPGVESVAYARYAPITYNNVSAPVHLPGKTYTREAPPPVVGYNLVREGYFRTMGVRILQGRGFTEQDNDGSAPVALINQRLADTLWPGENPLGRRLSVRDSLYEVVGVTGNGTYFSVLESPRSFLYLSARQVYDPVRVLHIKTQGEPSALAANVREVIRSVDPLLPVFDLMTMESSLEGGNGYFVYNIGAMLAGVMGLIGLVLATLGVYGVVSFNASQRTHEIGIRMALGARRRSIYRLVIGQGFLLTVAGLALGLLMARVLMPGLGGFLNGVSPFDPLTYIVFSLFLLVISLGASFLPAYRASRIDPMVALRCE